MGRHCEARCMVIGGQGEVKVQPVLVGWGDRVVGGPEDMLIMISCGGV